MGVTVPNRNEEEKPEYAVVAVSGRATVCEVGEMHAALMAALAANPGVVIDLAAVSAVDAAFLQLIASITLSAECEGHQVTVKTGDSSVVYEAALSAGFRIQEGPHGITIEEGGNHEQDDSGC